MNIVFWALVILALGLTWFCLSFAFPYIGRFLSDLFQDAKEEMKDDMSENQKECEDDYHE